MSDTSTTSITERLAQVSEARASFMGRVRAALGRRWTQPPREPAPAVDEALARLAGADDDLPLMFAARATAVGMSMHAVTADTVAAKLITLCETLNVRSIGVGVGAVAASLGLEPALRDAGVAVLDWRSAGFDAQYALDAGLTDVHAAIAETGTLVCCSGAAHSRGLSLVPRVHFAVVRVSDVLPDMIDYWARLKGLPHTELPSSQVFITGPSKTADIEGELITGVHGPECVHVLLIDDAVS